MSNLVFNEQTKLFATGLDRVSTACFTVGVLAPVAGAYLNLTASAPAGVGGCCLSAAYVSVVVYEWQSRSDTVDARDKSDANSV